MQKNGSRPPFYNIYKNKFKMDQRLKCQTPNHKNPKRKHKQENLGYRPQQYFIGYISPGKENERKYKKWDRIKLKNFCTAKENINKIKRKPTQWEDILEE